MGKARPVVVGVDVGGSKILVGYVGVDGAVHRSQRYPMDRTSQATTLESIRLAVDDYMRVAWTGPALLSMGVGLVGHADPASGTWAHAMNLPIPTPVPLAAQMREWACLGQPAWRGNTIRNSWCDFPRIYRASGNAVSRPSRGVIVPRQA